MYRIYCDEPKTYFCSEPVNILDEDKNIFYIHPNKEQSITFNLPIGFYFTNNNLEEKHYQPYGKKPNVKFPFDLDEMKVLIASNKHTATIRPFEKTITVDPNTANIKYKPALAFLLRHEVYHLVIGGSRFDGKGNIIFDAEKACDDYAKKDMLYCGYNPTQITIAKELLLTSPERKKCIEKNLNFRR